MGTAGMVPSENLASSARRMILFYVGILIVLLTLGAPSGALFEVPMFILMKNRLHLEAHQVATFRFLGATPLYLSVLFGLARDMWNPFGRKDRGFIILFGGASAAVYAVFCFVPATYSTMLIALLIVKVLFLFVSSAQNGLTSVLAQQNRMSGQISAAWHTFLNGCGIAALLASGYFTRFLETWGSTQAAFHALFIVAATIWTGIALYGVWRPGAVFDSIRPETEAVRKPLDGIRKLFHYRPLYPAFLIWFLWNFQPGSDTSLFYYLENTIHLDDAVFTQWNAINAASFIPAFLLFGYLCRKVALRSLLFGAALVAIPQWAPLLLIHSVPGALIAAIPIGLLGGAATAGYLALLIRSCPPGLQGTTLMMATGLNVVAARFGDVLGTELYDHFGGFLACVMSMAVVYTAILPVLFCVPRTLINSSDGQSYESGHSNM
jgi:hypothetical protein